MPNATAFVLSHESDPNRKTKSMNIIALAITRSLGRKGIPVVRIHPNKLERSLSSKYCSRVEVSPDFYDSEQDLLAFLLDLKKRHAETCLLIPASDDCAYFASKYRDALSGAYEVVSPPWSVMETIIDKKRQYESAQQLGVPIPETYFPTGIEAVRQLATELRNFPYVIKPLVAHSWRRASMKGASEGKKGFAVSNGDELIARYESIVVSDKNVMIQEVIGGSDERLFTFLAYLDFASRPIAYCIRKKVRQLPVDFGYCTMTVSCHDNVVKEQSIRLLRGLGFHGLCGVEWKLDPATGIYKLIEVNPRAVNTTAIAPACGVDLPYIAYIDKTGGEQQHVTEWEDGIRWLDMEQDFWAARTLHRQGKLSFQEWWQSLGGRKIDAIFAADDVMPYAGHFLGSVKSHAASLWQRRVQVRQLRRHPLNPASLADPAAAKKRRTVTLP